LLIISTALVERRQLLNVGDSYRKSIAIAFLAFERVQYPQIGLAGLASQSDQLALGQYIQELYRSELHWTFLAIQQSASVSGLLATLVMKNPRQ